MSDVAYPDIISILVGQKIFYELFDISRIVDAERGKLLEMKGGFLFETNIPCNDVFGTDKRCKNCTSIRAHYSKEAFTKLEYINESVLLILSIPVVVDDRHVVIELAKDITKSMAVDVKNQKFSEEIPAIIDKFNKISTTDPLTHLQNRRTLDDSLSLALDNCRKMDMPLSLVMIDIDHFKKINDTFGHQHGDVILQGVAQIILTYIRRNSDLAVRYGGEEILLCFPGVSLEDCIAICARIHRQVQESLFPFNGKTAGVTASMGIAESRKDGVFAKDDLIALADKRLYEAKHTGRNRIVSGL